MSPADGTRAKGEPSVVRPARREDMPRIWELVRELAVYERLEHHLTGTPEQLARHLFGDAWPRAEALVAEHGGEMVGYAIIYPCLSSFWAAPILWLEDLYVRESLRGLGIGRALLAEVARIAVERGCPRVGWAVLDWNREAMEFYRRLGGGPSKGWTPFALEGAGLAALAAESRAPSGASGGRGAPGA